MFGMDVDRYHEIIEDGRLKERSNPQLMGMSAREAQIWLSEDVMKPKFGKDVFGQIAANKIESIRPERCRRFVVTDCGFTEEAEVLVKRFPGQVRVVQIQREGCSFDGDSRDWLDTDVAPTLITTNNGSTRSLFDRVYGYLMHGRPGVAA